LRAEFVVASVIVATGCLANILPAAAAKLQRSGTMPLAEFVDLYVRLRHPHHYDPSSWPFAVWLAFLFWVPFAAAALLPHPGLRPVVSAAEPERTSRTRALVVPAEEPSPLPSPGVPGQGVKPRFLFALAFFLALQLIALFFAGVFYVSETLVQMSLFRFSIVPHLMLVTVSAVLLTRFQAVLLALPAMMLFALAVMLVSPMADVAGARFGAIAAIIVLGMIPALWPTLRSRRAELIVGIVAIAGVLGGWRYVTGLTRPVVAVDPAYLALCAWSADAANTPVDAVFLVPPYEEEFRWNARRAIVVNWKSPPQLAGELPQWRDRMSAALGLPNLDALPRGSYPGAIDAMERLYAQAPPEALFAAAREYGARYVVAVRDFGPAHAARRVGPAFGRYLLYDARR
jgi:MFS family permease